MAFGTGFWNMYPGTDLHEIDLHYVLMQLLQLRKDMQQVVDSQAITFADPINWNITSQYPANQVVLDSNGDGYISRQPVPAGIPLSNTSYWTQIFSFNDIADRIRASIAVNAGTSATTPEALAQGALVWWQGDIYRAMVAMPAGTAFIEGTNVERYTVDEKISAFISQIGTVAADLAQEVQDREAADTALQTAIGGEQRAREDADDTLDDKIDQEIQDRQAADAALETLINTKSGTINYNTAQGYFEVATQEEFIEALKQLNKGLHDLRIMITASGNYSMAETEGETPVVTNCSFHLRTSADNVTIDMAGCVFYNVHFNWAGTAGQRLKLTNSANSRSYVENCETVMAYCDMYETFCMYGGFTEFTNFNFYDADQYYQIRNVGGNMFMDTVHVYFSDVSKHSNYHFYESINGGKFSHSGGFFIQPLSSNVNSAVLFYLNVDNKHSAIITITSGGRNQATGDFYQAGEGTYSKVIEGNYVRLLASASTLARLANVATDPANSFAMGYSVVDFATNYNGGAPTP